MVLYLIVVTIRMLSRVAWIGCFLAMSEVKCSVHVHSSHVTIIFSKRACLSVYHSQSLKIFLGTIDRDLTTKG